MAYMKVVGTEQFELVAKKLRDAGDRKTKREMGKAMKKAADPILQNMRSNVTGLSSKAKRSGSRAKRTAYQLSRRKKVTDRLQTRAHAGSGLRSTTARATVVQVKMSGNPSVRIRVDKGQLPPDQRKLPGYMNDGKWRHPVMGNRKAWVTQTVSPREWFDRPANEGGPKVRKAAVDAVEKVIDQI